MTIDLSVLDVGSQLVTRDGRRARLLANDVDSHLSCVVAVRWNEMEHAYGCSGDGRMSDPCPVEHREGFRIVALAPRTVRVRVIVYMVAGLRRATAYADNEEFFVTATRDEIVADEIVEITMKEPAR